MDGTVKDQKMPQDKKGKKGKKADTRMWAEKSKGQEVPSSFYQELSWLKEDVDYAAVSNLMENILSGTWSLQEFSNNIDLYKRSKFLKLQLCSMLKLATWTEVLQKYDPNDFANSKLITLLEELGKLKLNTAKDGVQGWYDNAAEKKDGERPPHSSLSAFMRRAQESKMMKERTLTPYDKLPNVSNIVLGPSDNPPYKNKDERLELVHAGKVFEAKDAPTELPKLNFTFGFADVMYKMNDDEGTSLEDIDTLLHSFSTVTEASHWTFVMFCSFAQLGGVTSVMNKYCNLGVEVHFWSKKQGTQVRTFFKYFVDFCSVMNRFVFQTLKHYLTDFVLHCRQACTRRRRRPTWWRCSWSASRVPLGERRCRFR
jgi:hypothetical protein